MSGSAVSSCIVVLNQQREQTVQYHDHCDQGTIAPCKALSGKCTIVENGQVVVRTIPVKQTQAPIDPATES